MSDRKLRRAAAHAALKLARKAGFPTTPPPTPSNPASVTNTPNSTASVSESAKPTPPKPPISPAQMAANRANSQHSTGPRTDSGRAASSQNHTSHGLARHNSRFKIFPTEDAAAFEALKADLAAEHQPTTVTESIFLNIMAESHWLANRAQTLADTCCDPETGLVDLLVPFNLYLRYQTTHRRTFHKALNDLLKLRAEKRKAENGFVAQQRKAVEEEIKNQIENEDRIWQDPTFKADCTRLGMASLKKGPEYDRLKAEFAAKYYPNQGATAQAAA